MSLRKRMATPLSFKSIPDYYYFNSHAGFEAVCMGASIWKRSRSDKKRRDNKTS